MNAIVIAALLFAAPPKKPPPKKEPPKKEAPKKETPAAAAPEKTAPKKAAAAAAPAPVDNSRETVKRESKIEFDERVVQGQRAQGAVYLFQRAETPFSSLVKTPESFRSRTVDSVYGDARRAP